MLTADLLRVTRRSGRVHPRYVDPRDPRLRQTASALVNVFARAVDTAPRPRREEIEEQIADLVGHRADPLLFRGFCKLLFDRSAFEEAADHPPEELRRALFEAATGVTMRREPGRTWLAKREVIVREVAARLDLLPEQLEASLYADLPGQQRLTAFKPIDAGGLLHRYNLALAQGVLLRATRLSIRLGRAEPGVYRQLFRALKFYQLIHTVTEGLGGEYAIAVDGPLSLFSNSSRYGVAMAQFLPTLVLLDRWWLEAELLWGRQRLKSHFRLDHKRGLVSHRRATGQYITREQEWLEERFAQKPGPWRMSRSAEILRTHDGEVVVPDLRFENEADGRLAHLEIIGFWRQGSLAKRLDQLDDPSLVNLVLAVSSRLAGDKKADPPQHPQIVWFKQVIPAARVRQRIEEVAVHG